MASGKGGTGKTTVAVNLALAVGRVNLLDCDVEEPNCHMLLSSDPQESHPVLSKVPEIDSKQCTLCGKCSDFCQFNALFIGKKGIIVYPEMCHSCGGCTLVCPEGAISERDRQVGTVYVNSVQDSRLIYGELEIGEPIATGVINAVKMHAQPEILNIIDAPPGTACPVIETMRNSDYILLVTEPTPFGLHDLSMTVGVVKELGIPCGVIINRAGIGNDAVKRYCESENIPILLEIPFERKIAELYSQGIPFVTEMPHWRNRFLDVLREIEEVVRHGD